MINTMKTLEKILRNMTKEQIENFFHECEIEATKYEVTLDYYFSEFL